MIMILIFITVLLFRVGSVFLPRLRHLNEDKKCQVHILMEPSSLSVIKVLADRCGASTRSALPPGVIASRTEAGPGSWDLAFLNGQAMEKGLFFSVSSSLILARLKTLKGKLPEKTM